MLLAILFLAGMVFGVIAVIKIARQGRRQQIVASMSCGVLAILPVGLLKLGLIEANITTSGFSIAYFLVFIVCAIVVNREA